jgi:hypothetical protein
MKYSIWLMTIVATFISVITPTAARAEGLGTQVIISPGGYSSTTIYEPYGTITTTTTTDQSIVNGYPASNSTSITTYSNNGGFYYINRPRRQYNNRYRQPSVGFQQNNIYPYSGQSACTTTIIGSPIPSPIPLNRSTGQPCR